jgi:hypothetical protein
MMPIMAKSHRVKPGRGRHRAQDRADDDDRRDDNS